MTSSLPTLRLVSSQAVIDVKDRTPSDVRRLLRAVLDAQLTPTLMRGKLVA